MFLRALSNAGLPSTLPTLLQYAENAQSALVSEAALKALRRMDDEHVFKDEVSHGGRVRRGKDLVSNSEGNRKPGFRFLE